MLRITDGMMSSRYMRHLNNSLGMVNQLSERRTTGRKYQKASEDTASALKAYEVRDNLSRINIYKDNMDEVTGTLSETESALMQVNGIMSDISDTIEQGLSDTNKSVRKTLANVLENYQGQLLQIANSKFGSKYIFGGENMADMPFKIDNNGSLLYQGKDMNDASLFKDEKYFYDIGLGFQHDASGNIIEGTVMDTANPGSEVFGIGTDDGMSNNIYNLLGDVVKKFENDDMTGMGKYTEKFQKISDDNLMRLSDIGQKTKFVEFLKERYSNSEYNAKVKQASLETVDMAEAIMDYSDQQASYNAALKMGAKIIQPSLLDYLN